MTYFEQIKAAQAVANKMINFACVDSFDYLHQHESCIDDLDCLVGLLRAVAYRAENYRSKSKNRGEL